MSVNAQTMKVSKGGETIAIYNFSKDCTVEFTDENPGTCFYSLTSDVETILGPNMLGSYDEDGYTRYCINKDLYPWIDYVNPNQTPEVKVHNRWTDINPITDVEGDWYHITGKNDSNYSPILSSAEGKYLTFAVTNTAMFKVYATGSATSTAEDGNYIVIFATEAGTNIVHAMRSTPGKIYGKGNASDTLSIDLDPSKKYVVSVMGAPEVNKDIQVTAIKLFSKSAALLLQTISE